MASQADREQVGRRGEILEAALVEARSALRWQALRHSPDEACAEEAVQEACVDFLRSYRGPAGVDAVRWLQVAVKRRAWGQGRRRRAEAARIPLDAVEQPAATPGPVERAERAELVTEFFAALALLKPDERTALLLIGLGFSYREIGERQGWTQTKVNRCVYEGRAALRALVD